MPRSRHARREHWERADKIGGIIVFLTIVSIVPAYLSYLDSAANSPPAKATKVSHSKSIRRATKIKNNLIVGENLAFGVKCDSNTGEVYPRHITPRLSVADPPGTGPTHAGKTWDDEPKAFGAVPASPVYLQLYLTGPSRHAVIITGLQFSVVARKPQVRGVWLQDLGTAGCASGGSSQPTPYHYGVIDFDSPSPYWLPADKLALPDWVDADILKFPYLATADRPVLILVKVEMEHCECIWRAKLTWVDDRTKGDTVIDTAGVPFETTSTTGLSGVVWSKPGRSWLKSSRDP